LLADITKNYGRTLLALNIAALVALLGFNIVQEREQSATAFAGIAIAASTLTVLAFGAGWATGWAVATSIGDRFTIDRNRFRRAVGRHRHCHCGDYFG
jgi:hypothetical protein